MNTGEQNNNMYRSLFEGSQASLADMAARQAQALSRVGRLRQSLVNVLRKNYANLVNAAEMSMGKKMNDADDEILLAYLESCVSASVRTNSTGAAQNLQEALKSAGFTVTGYDLLLWADQIRAHAASLKARETPSTAPTPRPVVAAPENAAVIDAQQDVDTVSWEEKTEDGDVDETKAAARTLADLFDDYSEPVLWEGPLGATNEETTWSPSPVKPAREAPTNGEKTPKNKFTDPGKEDDKDPVPPASWDDGTSGPEGAFDDDPRPDTTRQPTIVQPVLKPEIITPSTAKKRPRKSKARVLAPGETEETLYGAAQSGSVDMDEQVRASLVAASSLSRPVFTRDLVSVAGSMEIVEAWETECRMSSEENNIRFVAPKSRHRLRGRLIVTERPGEPAAGDWWWQATNKYRAGRLYELGVLLHRVGEEVVTYKLDDNSATFHLSTPKGLVGVLVVLSPVPAPGLPDYDTIRECLRTMFNERLVLLAVLTASGEKESLASLTDFVKEQAAEFKTTPLMPVVAARSWEYSDDRGSSAVLLFP